MPTTSAASIDRATITNNTIVDFRAGVGIRVRAGNPNAGGPVGHAGTAGSATDVITITGNSMNGGDGGIGNQPDRFFTGGVSGNGGQGNFNISNHGTAASRLRNIDCIAIEVQVDGPDTMTSTVQNNFINATAPSAARGSPSAPTARTDLGAGTHTTLISANNVMGTDGPGTSHRPGLGQHHGRPGDQQHRRRPDYHELRRAGSGSTRAPPSATRQCASRSAATPQQEAPIPATATTSPGINLRKQGTNPDINTFGVEGLTPSPTGTPNVENRVNGTNTSTSGTFGPSAAPPLAVRTDRLHQLRRTLAPSHTVSLGWWGRGRRGWPSPAQHPWSSAGHHTGRRGSVPGPSASLKPHATAHAR